MRWWVWSFGSASDDLAFDKLPAQFVVDSDTQITATTPDSTIAFTSGSDLPVIVTTRPAPARPTPAHRS